VYFIQIPDGVVSGPIEPFCRFALEKGDLVRRCILVLSAAVCVFAASLSGTGAVHAQSLRHLTTTEIRIAPDFAVTKTIHQETTPLVESAVRAAAQFQFVVQGNQTVEVVEAFTRKADGRSIKADPSDFVTQDGSVGAAMSFVDLKVQQIPFRDISVGDTAVLTLRITETEHYIPGQFSWELLEAPSVAQRTIDVTLRTSASLGIYHDEQKFAYQESRQGDDIVRHWSGKFEAEPTDEKNVADLAFAIPGLRVSTFPGHEAIATAYYEQAKAKAAVTPAVKQLAEEITRDKGDVPAQAEAIFKWVSRNIRYVAVYFGNGRYVPNDTSTILSRRFGDCKDDATLVSALLAAKGIESEQVLLGTDPSYRFSKTATLGAFNHVIVYIPALDRYVDPTVPFGAFAQLPSSDAGKPVVRVSDKGAVLAKTPLPAADDNAVEIDTRVVTSKDGSRQGQTRIEARGSFADLMRAFVAAAEAKGKDAALGALAQQRGIVGEFDMDAPAWTDNSEPFRVTTKWNSPKPTNPADAGLRVPTGFSPVLPHPDLFFGSMDPKKRVYAAGCLAGRIVHTVHVALPDNVTSIKLPPAVKKNTPQFSYTEEWSREGRNVQRRTEVRSVVASRVCSPAEIDAVSTAYRSLQNRTNPVVYFAHAAPAPAAARPGLLQQFFGGQQPAAVQRPPARPAPPAGR
jgi:transglutaminase-like putative cysteine protease